MDIEKSKHLQRDINEFKREKKPLGKGQFGCVYPCTDLKNGKKYAIKLIEPAKDVSTEDYAYKLFTREVTIQSQVRHRALLPLYCWGENCKVDEYGEISFIMSPLMQNGSLDMFINDKKYEILDPTKKMIIIYGSAVGMRHLHKRGVMHRDLKPGNILIDELYYPYIGDFGFSKYTPKNNDTTFSIRPGTPLYTAPELLEDDESLLSNKVDVYAFGIIIFNILTGKQFSDIKSSFKLQEYVMKGNRPPIPKDINDFYRQLITRCWSQSPADRPSFEEIVNLLEKPENLLLGANKNKFEKYKKHVNDDSLDDDEEEEGEDSDGKAKPGSGSLPLKTFNLSFRGYPQISLSKSHNFTKFMLFYFNFNDEREFNINLGNNITVGDAKIVIAIEQIIPPSYLEITFNGKELNEKGKLSTIKCSKKNPIHIKVIKDISDLPSDQMEREVEVENEIHELVNFKTTKRILKSGKPGLMDSLDVFYNFFVCGKSITLFNSCIESYEKM